MPARSAGNAGAGAAPATPGRTLIDDGVLLQRDDHVAARLQAR
jgi:hypothetical protein